ncbi:MAG: DUF1573 domain-containing protein [Deltaproteobacteria bacterium]|nr:DUF1573 domain-containing protein [Deltaproteobacteria bacterium]
MGQTRRVFFFFALFLTLSIVPTVRAEGPVIVIDNPEYNFGQVFAGTQVSHIFGFRNTGTTPLIIEKVRHSCGCTTSEPSSRNLEPGESAEIKSTFDSSRFNGPQVKTIYLYSNDPTHSVVQLYMRGIIKKEITQHPGRVSLTKLVPEITVRREVALVNHGENQIFLEEPLSTTPELAASLSGRSLPPGQSLTVTVLVTPKEDNRRVNGYVIIPLSGAFLKEIQIPVYGEISLPPKP